MDMANAVSDNISLSRFEMNVGGQVAFMTYKRNRNAITLLHTEVPEALSGQGIGSALVRGVIEAVRSDGLKIIPKCPFVSAYIARHPEHQDLLA